MADTVSTGFNPTITPQQVYSAENIAYTPTPIDYSDPYKLRDYFLNTPDLVASRNAVAEANKNLIATRQTGRAQQQAIQENPMAMNVIRGTQAVAGQQSALREQAAAENLLAAQSTYDTFANEANARYGIAQQEREKLQSLITQTGGKAGISYADTFENALAKATSYQEKLTKDAGKKAKKEAEDKYKQSLKAAAMELGISTKTKKGGSMSVKDLEKAISNSKKSDKNMQDELNRLKLESERVSIANTKSLISERGKKSVDEINIDKSDNGIAKLIEQAINANASWEEIATKLNDNGVNINTGSFADKYLNFKFGKGKNPTKD